MKELSGLFIKIALFAFFVLIASAVAGIAVYHSKIKKLKDQDK